MAAHKHVFTALVTDKDQPLELMAYAIYKADKNEIAESLIAAGKNQQEIEAELKQFHDLVLSTNSLLKNYHTRARALGQNLINELTDGIKTEAKQDFIDRVEQLIKSEQGIPHKIGTFLLDAFKGVLSTLVVIIFFSGAYSLTLGKDDRSAFYQALGKSIVDTTSGEIPFIDNIREELKKRTPPNNATEDTKPALPQRPATVPPQN